MSLKHEQYRALKHTRELLYDMLYPSTRPKKASEMRERANRCLRHFPMLMENGQPVFSNDDFPCPPLEKSERELQNERIVSEVREACASLIGLECQKKKN